MMSKEYIDVFLKYLNQLYSYNKMKDNNFVISADMVYTILINYGVNNNENIRPLFNIWVDRFNKRPGINVIYLKNSYFCYFASGIFNPMNSIKLYIPLKKHNLDQNVTRIFEYMRANNIAHISKISMEIRNDDLVIRTNKENVSKIINFITNDNEIKKDLGPLNPLVPNFYGIGVTKDGSKSYNYFLSGILAECLNRGMILDANNYSNYLRQISLKMEDNEKMICVIASKVKSNITLDEIINYDFINEKSNKVLLDAMESTKRKYGIKQLYSALYRYITTNDALGFTRGEKNYRYNLKTSLNSNDVKNIIDKSISKNVPIIQKIEMFVNSIYADEIAMNKENENMILEDFLDYLNQLYNSNDYNNQKLSVLILQMLKSDEKFEGISIRLIVEKILLQIYPNYTSEQIKKNILNKEMIYTIINLVGERNECTN